MLDKIKASGLHLMLSTLVLTSVFGLIMWGWYPGFLYEANDAWQGSKVVVAADLVLGPLLTFLIFKRGKKGLKLDLTVIALLQIVALGYGASVLYFCRPLAIVLMGGVYYSVSADVFANYKQFYVNSASAESVALCGFPCYLLEPNSAVRKSVMVEGVSARVRQDLYQDYASHWASQVPALAIVDTSTLRKNLQAKLTRVQEQYAQDYAVKSETLAWVPISGRDSEGYVCVGKADGRIYGYIDVK